MKRLSSCWAGLLQKMISFVCLWRMRTPSYMPSSSLIFSALVCAILVYSWNMYRIPDAVKKSVITSTKVSHVISKININVTSLK